MGTHHKSNCLHSEMQSMTGHDQARYTVNRAIFKYLERFSRQKRSAKAPATLRICADSPEPALKIMVSTKTTRFSDLLDSSCVRVQLFHAIGFHYHWSQFLAPLLVRKEQSKVIREVMNVLFVLHILLNKSLARIN